MRILVDARQLSGEATGTGKFGWNLIRHWQRKTQHELTLWTDLDTRTPDDLVMLPRIGFGPLRGSGYRNSENGGGTFDLLFRPHQFGRPQDLVTARARCSKIISTVLDMIAYDSPFYHSHYEDFVEYRRAMNLTNYSVNAVVFLCHRVNREHLVRIPRPSSLITKVIGTGIAPPSHDLDDLSFSRLETVRITVVGNGLGHKNLEYSIRLLHQLPDSVKAWIEVDVVGVTQRQVRSRFQRAEYRRLVKGVKYGFHLGLSERQLGNLLKRSTLVLCPSVREGFGYLPFEAAQLGVASLSGVSSVQMEVMGSLPYELGFNSTHEDSQVLRTLLCSPSARQLQVQRTQVAARRHTWEKCVHEVEGLVAQINSVSSPFVTLTPSDILQGSGPQPVKRSIYKLLHWVSQLMPYFALASVRPVARKFSKTLLGYTKIE